MRFVTAFSVALAATGVAGNTWFSRSAYNKWHEHELERWLSDHDVPYPNPADRKDLENLVEKNWNEHVVSPYQGWGVDDLTAYLKSKGVETKEDAEATRDTLLSQVKSSWYETEDKAQQAYLNTKDWILDTWTESELKAFCDRWGISVPQPRNRDALLQKVRENYDAVAKKAGETAAYPGNWLYQSWSDSDLKQWLETHGFPAPQPTTRDKLVASVRRNSRLAHLKMQLGAAEAAASAKENYASLTDKTIDAWSESSLKEFCDKNGINVPQATKIDELRALVRKHRAAFMEDTIASTASSAFGAATSKASNEFAKATDSASLALQDAFNQAINMWAETRLKAYLDARGIPVPHASKADELRALVRKNHYKARSGWTAWTFDDFTTDNLRSYLASSGNVAAEEISKKTAATRDELLSAAQSALASASSAGGKQYASATGYLAQATEAAKKSAFDTWSESELKAYLDSYGIPVPQGSTLDQIRAYARRQYTYFTYGTSTPTGTILAKLEEGLKDAWNWATDHLNTGAQVAHEKIAEADAQIRSKIKEEL